MFNTVKALIEDNVQLTIVLIIPLVLKQFRLWHISILKEKRKADKSKNENV